MNKTLTIIVIIIVLLVAGIFIWYWMGNNNSTTSYTNNTNSATTNNNATSSSQNQAKGTMYFSIADAAVNMGTVTAVNMTIDTVQAYNKVGGWVTVSQTPQTFSLLQLKAKHQAVLLGKVSVPAGTYSQFRLHVVKVMITASGTTKPATLPSGDLVIVTDVMLNPKTSSAVQFDMLADKSLHQTDKGEFVFTPVVTFSSRMNATVAVGANNVMSVSFGETNADVNVGMDVDGQIKKDFMVSPNAVLNINGGMIQLNAATNILK